MPPSITPLPKRPHASENYVFDAYGRGSNWHWRLWARNGKIIATGHEAFRRKAPTLAIYNHFRALPGGCALFVNLVRII